MSRAPRRQRRPGRHGLPTGRAPERPSATDPEAGLRALVEDGIIAAAALNAREDLEFAAASTQRLGTLTSGMWRALGRELATAAERLDRSTLERLDSIDRRARALDVDTEEIVVVGTAAAHLDEHRERLETLLLPSQDAHQLLAPNMLFGFSLAASKEEEEEEEEDGADDDAPMPTAIEVELFLWPAPLTPARVSIEPLRLLPGVAEGAFEPGDGLRVNASPSLLDALKTTTQLSDSEVEQALIALAVACWSAHALDELPPDPNDEEDEDEDDEEGTQGDAARGPGDR